MFSAYPGIAVFTAEWAEMSTGAWGVRGVRKFESGVSSVYYCKPHGGGQFCRACGDPMDQSHSDDELPADIQRG